MAGFVLEKFVHSAALPEFDPAFKVYLAIFWPSVHMIWPMELLQLHTRDLGLDIFKEWATGSGGMLVSFYYLPR